MDCISGFDIRLEKDVFYPGEQLSGVVLLETTAPIRLRGIRVFLRGRARVQWKMLKSGESRTLKDDQYLLDEKMLLWGRDRHDDPDDSATDPEQPQTQILPRGTHEMAFGFQLPATQMPCSLETKAGTVRYYIKVIVDVPYASSPQGLKYFTLIGPHTDCMEEKYLCPLSAQDHQVRCFGCCRRGVVALRAVLERSAYCCGDVLRLCLQLENRQHLPATVCVRLVQHIEYRIDRGQGAPVDTKSVQSTALEWRSPFVPEQSQYRLEPGQEPALRVPVIPPTMVGFCRLVQLYYVLRVCAEERRKGDGAVAAGDECFGMDFPLTVGTVPYRPAHSQLYSVAYDFCVDSVDTGKYISPEFRLGQVWDGGNGEEKDQVDEVVLYRPVYVKTVDRGAADGARPPLLGRARESPPPLMNGASKEAETQRGRQRANTTAASSMGAVNFPSIGNSH